MNAYDKKHEFMKKILESMDHTSKLIMEMNSDPDLMDESIPQMPQRSSGGDDDLLGTLDEIFTPILIMQGFENNTLDKIQEAFSESATFTEKNIIQFDNSTRMAQLISVCALLIARKKNSPKYQAYENSVKTAKAMKIDIQKEEYDQAQALAQKFLVKVSTTNNSPVARQAANELLPETQH